MSNNKKLLDAFSEALDALTLRIHPERFLLGSTSYNCGRSRWYERRIGLLSGSTVPFILDLLVSALPGGYDGGGGGGG